jgi:MFS family permease
VAIVRPSRRNSPERPAIWRSGSGDAGVLDSFLPLAKGIPSDLSSAALLVQAITATLTRWQAGKHGDRYGHARLLIPVLAVAALGMAAMMVLGSTVMIFAGGAQVPGRLPGPVVAGVSWRAACAGRGA